MIRSQDSLYLTYSRILVIFHILHRFVTRICQYFYLIASCDGVMHESDVACSIREHLVLLLAGPISHTSTPCVDFVEIFNIVLDLSAVFFSF